MRILRFHIIILALSLSNSFEIYAQPAPAPGDNIPYLVTFGKDAPTSYGDDDFVQTWFVLVPSSQRAPFYVRVFDPDCGDAYDEMKKASYETKTEFSVYGGNGSFSNKAARLTHPEPGYDSGNLLASKVFGASRKYDDKWYSFGPFNPSEGEYVQEFNGVVFKIIAKGLEGDDGNLYKYYVSTNENENKAVEGANLFTYEYTCRLKREANSIAHIYPFITKNTIAIKQTNFDFDSDGAIRLISSVKMNHSMAKSGDDVEASSKHQITKEEQNGSVEIQFHKFSQEGNNIGFYITNQFDEALPFFAIPIGGAPKYEYRPEIEIHGK